MRMQTGKCFHPLESNTHDFHFLLQNCDQLEKEEDIWVMKPSGDFNAKQLLKATKHSLVRDISKSVPIHLKLVKGLKKTLF